MADTQIELAAYGIDMNYYLAIDIGASSGRHILAHIDGGHGNKLCYEEIHRFKNSLVKVNGMLCWDYEYLFHEIKKGLKKCFEIGKLPLSVSIDTWGVDFVLLDKDGKILGEAVSYRDDRTIGVPEQVFSIISEENLYGRTGIQKQRFNTIFQLYALKKSRPELFSSAEKFLMVPDYLSFLLTGIAANEYTNATTTGLVSAVSKEWDFDIIDKLGFDAKIFKPLRPAGTMLGRFKNDVAEELGYNADVIMAASHDTASAVLATPYAADAVYISSGTWSLIGTENSAPVLSEESRTHNFTNEGGYGYKYRHLKNIMGLWMLQSVKNELCEKGEDYSFDELARLAEENAFFNSYVNVTDLRFLSPDSMTEEIQRYCSDKKQTIPQTVGEISAVVYGSLAMGYAEAVREIEDITGKSFDIINIVGGGSRDEYLCGLTEKFSGKRVVAGPAEATALGNVLSQMICTGEINDVRKARNIIAETLNDAD